MTFHSLNSIWLSFRFVAGICCYDAFMTGDKKIVGLWRESAANPEMDGQAAEPAAASAAVATNERRVVDMGVGCG